MSLNEMVENDGAGSKVDSSSILVNFFDRDQEFRSAHLWFI